MMIARETIRCNWNSLTQMRAFDRLSVRSSTTAAVFTKQDVDKRLVDAFAAAFTAVRRFAVNRYVYPTDRYYDPLLVGEFATTLRRELLPTWAPWRELALALSRRHAWSSLGKVTGEMAALLPIRYRLHLDDGEWTCDIERLITVAKIQSDSASELDVDVKVRLKQLEDAMKSMDVVLNRASTINVEAETVVSRLISTIEAI